MIHNFFFLNINSFGTSVKRQKDTFRDKLNFHGFTNDEYN